LVLQLEILPRATKKPRVRGFSQCAREDSNLHGLLVHKALNLARLPIPPQALGAASIERLESVHGPRYLYEHMFDRIDIGPGLKAARAASEV
jgi:hypothetical protein